MSTKTSISRQRLLHLVQELEDGTITTEDHQILMSLLRDHPTARREYLRYMQMVAVLQETAKSRAEFGGMPVSQDTMQIQKRRSALSAVTYAMAALLVLGLVFLVMRPNTGVSKPLAGGAVAVDESGWISIQAADSAAYSVSHRNGGQQPDQHLLAGDRVNLSNGLLRLVYPSGVEVVLEGPTDVDVINTHELAMQGGSGWFRVPEAGRGFTIRTEQAKIVDHGTEFGLKFSPMGSLQVHVTKGRVTAEPPVHDGLVYDLTAGKALEIDAQGNGRSIPLNGGAFQQKFSQELPYIHWSFDHLDRGAFVADGPLATGGAYGAKLMSLRSSAPVANIDHYRADGVFGPSLSLKGDGVFAEADYPAMGVDGPRSFAAWIRPRDGQLLDDHFERKGVNPEHSPLSRSYSTVTPCGRQAYLLYYTNASISTDVGAIPGVIEKGVEYSLTFRASIPHGDSKGVGLVELVAYRDGMDPSVLTRLRGEFDEQQVLATLKANITQYGLGYHGELKYRAGRGDPRIGQKLGIRLHKTEGAVFYDEIQLTARRNDGSQQPLFYEGFEKPEVIGMVPDSLPASGWVGATENYGAISRGLYNESPLYAVPYCAWSGEDARAMWAVFMDHGAQMRLSTGSGGSWFSSKESHELRRNQWIHVASVYTGRLNADGEPEVQHYLNGVPLYHVRGNRLMEDVVDRLAGIEAKMRFGAFPLADYGERTTDSDIDEVYLLRGVLTQQQLVRLMQSNRLSD